MTDKAKRWTELEPEEWSDEAAELLHGAYILVGITYFRPNGEIDRQEQIHGVVEDVDRGQGIQVALKGARAGETFNLPPSPSWFDPAPPGVYQLKSTGEAVTDPDFLTTLSVNLPPSKRSH